MADWTQAGWTHSICYDCWEVREPGRKPVQLNSRDREQCCVCGVIHWSGIYIRQNPQTLAHCGGHDG